MRQVIITLICFFSVFSANEAHALFGRRGPIATFFFGPGPQIIGSRRCGGGMCRPMDGPCGGGGCRPQGGGCGPGGCGGGGFNPQQFGDQIGNGFNPGFGGGMPAPGLGGGNGLGSQQGFGGTGFGNGFGGAGGVGFGGGQGGIVDPSLAPGAPGIGGGGGAPLAPGVGSTGFGGNGFGVGNNSIPPAGSTPGQLQPVNGTFLLNNQQISIGQGCRFVVNGRELDREKAQVIFASYQQRLSTLNENQRCAFNTYARFFNPNQFTQPGPGTGAPTAPIPGTQPPPIIHGGTTPTPTQPGRPNVGAAEPTAFAKWSKRFEGGALPVHKSLAEKTEAIALNPNVKYTVVQQDCVHQTAQNNKVPVTMILFHSSKDGSQQTHVGVLPPTTVLTEANKGEIAKTLWASVKEDVTHDGGRLRSEAADPGAFSTKFNFKNNGPEMQIQVKEEITSTGTQLVTRYVQKGPAPTPAPANIWKPTSADQVFYCVGKGQVQAPPPPVVPTVVSNAHNVLSKNCLSCHQHTMDDLLKMSPTKILEMVNHQDPAKRMPKKRNPLTQEEKQQLDAWKTWTETEKKK